MKSTINFDHVIYVKVYDQERCWSIYYQPYVKRRFKSDIQEGYYSGSGKRYTSEDLQAGKFKGLKLETFYNVVYYQPKVVITMVDSTVYEQSFKTYEAANKAYEFYASKIPNTFSFPILETEI